ncbi:hypothetical protein PFICI_05086 [Pestalotiopsis fici W106-1]|uniref:Carrier domain-containing protein n=1 Tax=Pestalotiopsis fici (strain W106-1 / CGMCC3.15140) TaxID=1229662 RepID=W3XAY5_PESFW|nr:uncharacterized protein PFICI_05086 [Pestalotiopsis fici W106-1]ETS83210.1 hypothetical protein PFICI_05086 [Pestalotiopsis fici W106-1]
MLDSKDAKPTPFGERLLPTIIDEWAHNHPLKEVFQIPNSSDPNDGWKVLSSSAYATAINHVAYRIIDQFGQPTQGTFPTIAYIGPNDVRYLVMMVAAIKAGYKAFFISPRNSHQGQIHLFKQTDCRIIAYPQNSHAMVQPWLNDYPMMTMEVEPLDTMLLSSGPHFPYDKTFQEAKMDPVVVLHTSGSTGLPKPVVARVGMVAAGDAMHNLPPKHGTVLMMRGINGNLTINWTVPLFHAAGLLSSIHLGLYWDRPLAFGVDRPMSAGLMAESIDRLDVDIAILPPSILSAMSQDDDCVRALKKLKIVVFGAGNLANEVGRKLIQEGLRLMNAISSTEFSPYPLYFQSRPELWRYFIIPADIMGADWRKSDTDGAYKLVIKRQGAEPGLQGVFYTFPDKNEYDTHDLFTPHPTLADHWLYYGRADDIIVFSNGEKLNPVTIEEVVTVHPQIQGALVVGSGRFQAGLLIEPVSPPESEEKKVALMDSVWSLVSQANEDTVAHGRIARHMIALTDPTKTFPRAGKGTIQRAAALKLFEAEIGQLYEQDRVISSEDVAPLDLSSDQAAAESVLGLFRSNLGVSLPDLDSDLFAFGVDSLQVINATKLLQASVHQLGHHAIDEKLFPKTIYSNPTPFRLGRYIRGLVIHDDDASLAFEDDDVQQQLMKQLTEKYTKDFTSSKPNRPEGYHQAQTIILTGSTGQLGSYLLDLLIRSPQVSRIVCLNRAKDGGLEQQRQGMKERGLSSNFTEKSSFHHADISKPGFGLPSDVLRDLLHNADRWIHNAWPVNFNIPLESFEPHLRGVRNVADFATQANKRVAVIFISSIGTASRWDSTNGPIPESRLTDTSLAAAGYGRSKMVGSLILEAAAASGDFPAAVLRVGQIAGPEKGTGTWNKHEWIPSLIASSLYLGALPSDLDNASDIDWTPVEKIAALVLELAGITQLMDPADISGYYHGVNPHRTTWDSLAAAIKDYYGSRRIRELISFKEWTRRLEESGQSSTEIDLNPGIKLLDTYRGMVAAMESGHPSPRFATQRTEAQSPTMRQPQSITPDLMKQWCKQWGF